jgi:hypothetical protein
VPKCLPQRPTLNYSSPFLLVVSLQQIHMDRYLFFSCILYSFSEYFLQQIQVWVYLNQQIYANGTLNLTSSDPLAGTIYASNSLIVDADIPHPSLPLPSSQPPLFPLFPLFPLSLPSFLSFVLSFDYLLHAQLMANGFIKAREIMQFWNSTAITEISPGLNVTTSTFLLSYSFTFLPFSPFSSFSLFSLFSPFLLLLNFFKFYLF